MERPYYSVSYYKGEDIYTIVTPKKTIPSAKRWFRAHIGYYTIIDVRPTNIPE